MHCAVNPKTVPGRFFETLLVISLLLLCCCSDEACTSGQLVIASRESQYKILHFHHAGLDKLAEVFQQWKCCRETQLKDQVRRQSRNWFYRASLFSTLYSNISFFLQATVEKSCMQFSIQRPTLPSAETHPEEKLYRRLDVSTWLRHLNQNGQVEEEYKLRKVQYLVYVSVSWAAT